MAWTAEVRGGVGRQRARLESALMTLGVDWTILVDLRIDAPPDRIAVDYLLLHPEHGVALVTVGAMRATATVDAAVIEGFRRFLLGRGFDTFFPGYLPIVRLTVAPQEAAVAGRLVVRAFADVPRLTIKERDWAEAIAIVLTASGSDAAPAEPPDPDQNLELRRAEPPASDVPPRPARAQPAAAPHLAEIARREDAEPAAAAAPARPVRAPARVASGAAPRPSGSLFARLWDGAARLNLRVPLSAAVARQPVDRAHPTNAPNRFEAAQSATIESATTQRETARREIGQPETARREAPPPATTQRETAHPEVARPETAERETTQREAGQHETVRSEIAQPAITQPAITQPAINQRETAPSETPQREIARPEITIAPARARDPKMTMAAKTAPVAALLARLLRGTARPQLPRRGDPPPPPPATVHRLASPASDADGRVLAAARRLRVTPDDRVAPAVGVAPPRAAFWLGSAGAAPVRGPTVDGARAASQLLSEQLTLLRRSRAPTEPWQVHAIRRAKRAAAWRRMAIGAALVAIVIAIVHPLGPDERAPAVPAVEPAATEAMAAPRAPSPPPAPPSEPSRTPAPEPQPAPSQAAAPEPQPAPSQTVAPAPQTAVAAAPPPAVAAPPPLDRIKLHRELAQLFRGFGCAELNATIADDGSVTLAGFVSKTDDLARLARTVSAEPQVKRVDNRASVEPWPFCELSTLLRAHTVGGPGVPQIQASHSDRVYRNGDAMVVWVTSHAPVVSYLYVDFFDSSGTVVHMLPTPFRPNNRMVVNQRVTLGASLAHATRGQRVYVVSPPFGAGKLVALSSPHPLFAEPRPEMENARTYLAALSRALSETPVAAGTSDISANQQSIQLVAR